MFIIYKATNTVTGMSYIGQTQTKLQDRIIAHYVAKSALGEALRASREADWAWSVIDSCDDKYRASELECYYIGLHRTVTNGYNHRALNTRLTTGKRADGKPWNAGRNGIYRQESLERMALAKLGSKRKPKSAKQIERHRQGSRNLCRRVKEIHTGIVYDSITQASEATGFSRAAIRKHLAGKVIAKMFEQI